MTVAAGPTLDGPYRGLAPFGDSDLDGLLFFGRERETEVTTANLVASRLTVLYGPSGVGKSSLLRAGVARRVRELGARRAIGRGPDLACVVFASWTDDPVSALADAIATGVMPLVSPTAPAPPAGATLADLAEHWSTILDGDLCLVLDQLEEYFVYHEDDSGPNSLVEQLPELVTRPALRANVLLSLRDDELSRLGILKGRLPHVFANARRLDRLDRDAARAAILGPLQRWNDLQPADRTVEIEPALVEAVLAQTSVSGDGGRVEAPYLQLVMERVWSDEAVRDSHVLHAATLEESGGAEAIVREHLDRALSVLNGPEQAAAARMFDHLVTPSGTKIAHRAVDLAVFAHVEPTQADDVLSALGRERIVRPLDDREGVGRRYEIFHDVLAQAILEWRHRHEVHGERLAARRRQRRLLIVAGAALAALVTMIAVTVYALAQRGDARAQARHARAAALTAGALAALPTDPELGLLLARDAAERERTPQAEDVLRAALLQSRGRAVLRGHRHGVLTAGFSRGRVVTIDGTGTLREFRAHTSRPIRTRPLGGRIRAAAFAGDGAAFVVARRRLVEVRDLASPVNSFAFRKRSPVRALAIDGRGDRIAVATLDGNVTVHTRNGPVFSVHPRFRPTSIALDDSGRILAVAGGHRAVVWRSPRRRPVAAVTHRADITGVALAPAGSLLAAGAADGSARLWRVPGGVLTAILIHGSPLTGVAFSPDGRALLTRSRDGRATTFDVSGGRSIAVLSGHRDAVTTAAFSAGGKLVVTGSDDGTARIWDPGLAPELQLVAHPAACCTALVTMADGALVAAGRNAIRYRGGTLARVYRQEAPVTAIARIGSVVLTGGNDGIVRVWRSPAGPTETLEIGGPVTALTGTPSEIVAARRGGEVQVWSMAGKKLLTFRERSGIAGLAASHDGRLLATAGVDGVARIRTLASGRLLHELTGHTKALTAVAFSPDDTLVATSSYDHDARLWTVASGQLDHLLRGHFAVVSGVAFSPDGQWVVTAGPTTAGLWRASSGTFLAFLRGHTGRLVGAGFTASGRAVITASADGTIRRYRCDVCGDVDALLQLADQRLEATGRQLTPAERQRYLGP